jgi:hypothetical protein
MKTIKRELLISSGIATGLLQMFPIMYSIRGACDIPAMLGTCAWMSPFVWGILAWAAQGDNIRFRRSIISVIMMGFGVGVVFGPWSPLLRPLSDSYLTFLMFITISTAIAGSITSGKGIVVFLDSMFLSLFRTAPKLFDAIVSFNLKEVIHALRQLTIETWGVVFGCFILFTVLTGICLIVGEFMLGSKDPPVKKPLTAKSRKRRRKK